MNLVREFDYSDRIFCVHVGLHVILFLYLNETDERCRWETTDEVTSSEALIGRTMFIIFIVNIVVRYHIIRVCG